MSISGPATKYPAILPVQAETIPAAMRAESRWLIWNLETRDGKPTKVPYQAAYPDLKADATNSGTWGNFTTAINAYQDGKADGIGFALGGGFFGFDADDCRDPQTGTIAPEVVDIIALLHTYTEVSPRAGGVKAIGRGQKPGPKCRIGRFELYDVGRFFCISGHHVPGTPTTVEDRTPEVAQLYARFFPVKANGNGTGISHPTTLSSPIDLDDAALLDRAEHARNGATFRSLWTGDTSQYGGDDSAADLALCNLLAFWTGADAGRMDRLFRQSGLMRAKWDSRRGAETYGEVTIAKAIAGCHDTYRPESRQLRRARDRAEAKTTMTPPRPAVPVVSADDSLTEAGAAERFVRFHGDGVRYDYRRNRWLMWHGHRWLPDADAAVMRLALDFVRMWQRAALEIPDRDKREATVKFAIRLERRDAINNMLAIARWLKPIADAGEHWDCDSYLLTTPTGVVHLRTGVVQPGHPDDGCTLQTAVPYEPDATCPRWEQFVSEIFLHHLALIDFVQRAIGYSLTGDTSEQVLFLLYGTGANGKGTLTNTLKRVLGDYAWNMPFATIEMKDRTAIPNDLAALVSRRFVIASETNDGARLNEARVKALTGCDPITARFLHGEFFTFEPLAKFWLSVNHKPIVRDDSFGFWRRLRLIPFSQRFEVNPALGDELQAEGPGILNWCIRGALAWQRDGLQAPAIVTEATREYEQDSDPLAEFLAQACEAEPAAEVGAKDLFEHYTQWAQQHGLGERERLSATGFGRKMSERFPHTKARGGKVYQGLARVTVTGLPQ